MARITHIAITAPISIAFLSELSLDLSGFLLVAPRRRLLAGDVLARRRRLGLDVLGAGLVLLGQARVAPGKLGLFRRLRLQRLLLLGELARLRIMGLGLLAVTADPFAEALALQFPPRPCPARYESSDHEQDEDHHDHHRNCQSG
jgi:hypothetical protein